MTFSPLRPPKKWSGSIAPVRASVRALNRGASLSLFLSSSLLKRLGWDKAALFEVLAGEGDSAGRVRVRPAPSNGAPDAYFAASKLPKSAGLRLIVGALADLPGGDHTPRDCVFSVYAPDGEQAGSAFVEITLPKWPDGAWRAEKACVEAEKAPAPQAAPGPQGEAREGRAGAPAPATTLKDGARPGQAASAAPAGKGARPPEGAATRSVAGGADGLNLKFSISDTLFALLCTKAGIAFGCSRAEVTAPGDKEAAMDAQCAVAAWLARAGYAAAVARKRFHLSAEDHDDAIGAAEALEAGQPKKWARFNALVTEASRAAAMPA